MGFPVGRRLGIVLAFVASLGAARITTAAPTSTTGCAPGRPAIAADARGKRV